MTDEKKSNGLSDGGHSDRMKEGNARERQFLAVMADPVNFAEFLPLIPIFSGENPDISIHDFLDKVQEVAGFAGWKDEQILFMARNKLAGEAARFIRSQPQLKKAKSFEELKQALIDRFQRYNLHADSLVRFTSATQGSLEGTRAYLTRVLGLSHVCFPGDESTRNRMLVHQCLSGLRPEVRRFIMAQSPKTYDDIWQLAVKEEECSALEDIAVNVNVAGVSAGPSNIDAELKEIKSMFQNVLLDNERKINELSLEVKGLREAIQDSGPRGRSDQNASGFGSRNDSRDIECYNCGKRGHISRYCWSAPGYSQKGKNLNSRRDRVGQHY